MLGIVTIRLTLLRTIDPTEANPFRVGVVQNLDGGAVEDRDNGAREVSEAVIGV